ncbi:MAG TPA: hypothetical protein VF771_11565 [Longimicrobiaceae bacterium]
MKPETRIDRAFVAVFDARATLVVEKQRAERRLALLRAHLKREELTVAALQRAYDKLEQRMRWLGAAPPEE